MNKQLNQEIEKAKRIVMMHTRISKRAVIDMKKLYLLSGIDEWYDNFIYKVFLRDVYRMRMDYSRSKEEYFYFKGKISKWEKK